MLESIITVGKVWTGLFLVFLAWTLFRMLADWLHCDPSNDESDSYD